MTEQHFSANLSAFFAIEIMSLILKNHAGDDVDFSKVAEEVSARGGRNPLVVTDMDGTMFDNDLGLMVFLEKLGDPRFWNHSNSHFKKLLLPDKYREMIKEWGDGQGQAAWPGSLCEDLIS